MTMPPLPNQGNKNWTTWGQAVHDAATEVTEGRLTEAELRAAFGLRQVTLSRPGELSASAGTARFPITHDAELVSVTATLGTAANRPVIVDVNCNGSSVFTDAADRPSIPAGSHSDSATGITLPVVAGDYLTIDVDQVGGTEEIDYIAATDSTGTTQAHTVSRPGNATTGDVHVAAVLLTVGGATGSTTEPTTVVTTPADWARIGTGPTRNAHNPSDRHYELHMFWWRDDGTQSSWTFTATQPASNAFIKARVITLRGAAPTGNPIDVSGVASPAASNSSFQAPSITTTVDGALVIGVWGMTASTITTPAISGMTNLAVTDRLVTAIEQRTDSGATGSRTLTGTTSPTSRTIAALVAVKPDPASTVPGSDLTVVIEMAG